MSNFFAELKRRHIYRVAAAYAVVAWLSLQIINNVSPVLDLPAWVARAFLLLLVIGFPITLLAVWARDLAPDDGATGRPGAGRLDWALIGAIVVVIGLMLYQQLTSSPGAAPTQQQQASVAVTTPSQPQPSGISIVVLPFANVSGDASREFFSDGMTDEISGALAKVRDLRVIARSSAFQFKGQNQDVRAVGLAVGASHLIEGSVSQAGNRVRITAQLVRAGDGVQLWSENYDRELTDIFVIQEEIAEAIAGALRAPLGLRQGELLISSRTGDLDSYEQFLRARALLRARSMDEATAILEPLVARDPGYAPAWALLSAAHGLTGFRGTIARIGGPVDEAQRFTLSWLEKSDRTAREAIRLDPRFASGYTRLAVIQQARGKWADAEDLFRRALALDPNDPETLDSYSRGQANVGYLKMALGIRQQLHALEPFVPVFNQATASIMIAGGQNKEAIRLLEAIAPDAALGIRNKMLLAQAYASESRYGEAADTLLAIPQQDQVNRRAIETAASLLRSVATKIPSLDILPELEGELNQLAFVYAYVDAPARALEPIERLVEIGHWGAAILPLWTSEFSSVRKTERFKTLIRSAGLVEYWRARGWPDLCRPMGADDFVCD
jgi:TolB-like protein